MMWNDGWGWGSWLAMSLMTLAFVGLIAWGLFVLWRASDRGRAEPTQKTQTPEAILRERLARGEITPHEYEERMEILRSPAESPRTPIHNGPS